MRWRLIEYAEAGPHWNMAVDEAMLRAFISGQSPPTLRFYGWTGPCVTIGRLQGMESVPGEWGTVIVRRPTGGRAVLHGDDLTFSIVVDALTLGSPVSESYRRVATALSGALVDLGVGVEMCGRTTPPASARGIANCFDLTLRYELALDGSKVLGSAQVRRSGAVLQQNSLALPKGASRPDREALTTAIARSIADEFQVELCPSELSSCELQFAHKIADNSSTIEGRSLAHP